MDWFRTFLIVSLAILGWNLIYQWNADYGVKPGSEMQANQFQAKNDSDEAQSVQSMNDNDSGVPLVESQDKKQAEASKNASQGKDLNQDFAPTQASNAKKVDSPATLKEVVQVKTDVFTAGIELNGGDLVALALNKYPVSIDRPQDPFVMLTSSDRAKFIAETGLIGSSARDLDVSKGEGRPSFSSPSKRFKMKGDVLVVPLSYENANGVKFEKRYIFTKGSYKIQIEHVIVNQSDSTWVGRPYGRLRRSDFADPSETGGFGLPTFLGAAYWDPEEKFTKLKFSDIEDEAEDNKTLLNKTIKGSWIGVMQHYFVTAWAPDKDDQNLYRATYNANPKLPSGKEFVLDAVLPQVETSAGETNTVTQTLYVGPKIQARLKETAHGLNLAVDYGPLFFISDALMGIMKFIYGVVGNYGFSIILLTVFVKLLLFPLSAKGYKSMAHLREVGPKLTALKKKYGDDRQKMSEELMKLYKKEKINPLGGCLPMIVQMPVFLALYWALLESVELRQAPFIFWIQDLSLMDPLFVLPLLMGASMWFQQRLNPEPPDPMQAKIMKFMPVVMTFLFLFFPSGLVLYWLTNNILSIAQQTYITKKFAKNKATSQST